LSNAVNSYVEAANKLIAAIGAAGASDPASRSKLRDFINQMYGTSLDSQAITAQVNALGDLPPDILRQYMLVTFEHSSPEMTAALATEVTQRGGKGVEERFKRIVDYAEKNARNAKTPEEREKHQQMLTTLRTMEKEQMATKMIGSALKPLTDDNNNLTVDPRNIQRLVDSSIQSSQTTYTNSDWTPCGIMDSNCNR
jgi:hypothetical protein